MTSVEGSSCTVSFLELLLDLAPCLLTTLLFALALLFEPSFLLSECWFSQIQFWLILTRCIAIQVQHMEGARRTTFMEPILTPKSCSWSFLHN